MASVAAVLAALGFAAACPRPAGARPASDAARAALRGPIIGIGEQKTSMFASREWHKLGLRQGTNVREMPVEISVTSFGGSKTGPSTQARKSIPADPSVAYAGR